MGLVFHPEMAMNVNSVLSCFCLLSFMRGLQVNSLIIFRPTIAGQQFALSKHASILTFAQE